MFRMLIAQLFMFSVLVAFHKGGHGYQKLCAHILSAYDMRVAPEFTSVKFGISLQRIIDLDITKKVLSLDTWIMMYWKDSRLVWDKNKEFENISQLVLPAKSLWIPDIMLYNSADGYTEFNNEIKVVVIKEGLVVFVPPKTLNSYCNIADAYTGNGNVTCSMKFGSWTYDADQLDLVAYSGGWDMSYNMYHYNRHWKLGDFSYERNVKFYKGWQKPYVDLTFKITLHPLSTH